MRRIPERIGRILVRCAREHDWSVPLHDLAPEVRRGGLGRLPAAAERHGIAGCAYRSLRGVDGVDESVAGALDAAAHRTAARHMNTLADLSAAASALDPMGSAWLVVKGPILAESLYRFPDLRSYADLDLLVAPSAFAASVDALQAAGATVLDRNWTLLRNEMRGQVHLTLPYGTVCDLHWHLVNRDRESFRVSAEELIARGRDVTLAGTRARTLDPEDTLLHLAVHACLAGGDRLVWLKDLELASAVSALDWDVVVTRARDWGVAPLVATMLDRARRALAAPVPPEVLRSLAGGARLAALAALGRISPVERTGEGLSLARIAARTTGRTPSWTVSTAARRVRSVFGRRPQTLHPSGVLDPGGGNDERAAFLDAVAGRARSQSRA